MEFEAKNITKIEQAARESQKLTQNLKALDFELTQFNAFTHRVKGFKLRGIIWGTLFGIFAGSFLTIFASKPLIDMYVEQKVVNVFVEKGIKYFENENMIQVYTALNSKTYKSGEYNVLEIQK